MWRNQIDPNLYLRPLVDEGYQLEIRDHHLLVHGIPYLTAKSAIEFGTLACTFTFIGEQPTFADNHQMYWSGGFPHYSNGQRMIQIVASEINTEIISEYRATLHLSSKPNGEMYSDHLSKVRHYAILISSQAEAVQDDILKGRTGVLSIAIKDDVFHYPDSSADRGKYILANEKLQHLRLAIVGLGGTGSYILDLVNKTPVREIHLFDGDTFESHNAFRSPGGASIADLERRPLKVDYYVEKYACQRNKGLVPHSYCIDQNTVTELKGLDFVFIAVDTGEARDLICKHLITVGIPFIDVGMGLSLNPQKQNLDGTCRTTLITPNQSDHFSTCVDTSTETAEAIYRSNIQVADLNALNATLAVIRWKQYFGFYQDYFSFFQTTFTVGTLGLAKLNNLDNGFASE